MRVRVKAMLVCLGLAVSLLTVSRADACDCLPAPAPRSALAQAHAVFEARVVAVQGQRARVSPLRSWKGTGLVGDVDISIGERGMCGVSLEEGRRYLIYAAQVNGQLVTDNCTRTTDIEHAGADIRELGPPLSAPRQNRARGGCAGCHLDSATGSAPWALFILLLLGWRRA